MPYTLDLKFADGLLRLELADPPRCPATLMALCIAGFDPTHHRESDGLLEWAGCSSDGAFMGSGAVLRELAHCMACLLGSGGLHAGPAPAEPSHPGAL